MFFMPDDEGGEILFMGRVMDPTAQDSDFNSSRLWNLHNPLDSCVNPPMESLTGFPCEVYADLDAHLTRQHPGPRRFLRAKATTPGAHMHEA